MDNEEQMEHEV